VECVSAIRNLFDSNHGATSDGAQGFSCFICGRQKKAADDLRPIGDSCMHNCVLAAIDLNDEGWRVPLLAGAEQARRFGSKPVVLTVVREVEPILSSTTGPLAYEMIGADMERQLAACVREAQVDDLKPHLIVTHGESIYALILGVAEGAGADLIVVGSHRPAMKDYLLGTNAGRVVRHAGCSVLVARK
jgi:nucleotide-binding universal stress UspA family protein